MVYMRHTHYIEINHYLSEYLRVSLAAYEVWTKRGRVLGPSFFYISKKLLVV